MSKKLKMVLGFTSTSLLLAACSGMTPEDIKESTDELEVSFNEIINKHKQLVEIEENMDDHFEEVLAEDESLATIQDESADVIQNITERETLVEEFSSQVENIKEHAEAIGAYEGEDFSEEDMQKISSDFAAFSTEVQVFIENYQESLNTQKDYLNQIAAEESDYEDFSAGIQTVNEDYRALQETTVTFDEQLAAFEAQLSSLQADIDEKIVVDDEVAETEEDATDENEDAETEEDATEADDVTDENAEDADGEEGTEEPEVTEETTLAFLTVNNNSLLRIPNKFPQKFVYDSGVNIEYPADGVKGIYVTAHSASGDRMDYLTNLINTTDLNAMVIDVKDDYGNVTLDLGSDDELVNEMTVPMIDAEQLMSDLEENDIYPIARIVVFKDTYLAQAKPEWSFTTGNGQVWSNGGGESFVNPYLKEIWDYNVEIAIQAAKLGFKDIQFDYVRFPEGFETRDRDLNYSHGHYGDDNVDVINMEHRNQAVTDFVAYAREQLQPYGADLSVDIFGYAAVVRETPGIGQSFPGISREVDVISSMIYPSHWGIGNLGVDIPDLDPYNIVANYSVIENEIMDELGEEAPISRPWIQDFTASYLGAGYYKTYGAQEVTEQVRALHDNGINEFLLWNAGNTYSEGATYSFE